MQNNLKTVIFVGIKNEDAYRILDYIKEAQNCPNGAKLLIEQDFELPIYDIVHTAGPLVEKHYNRAVGIIESVPGITYPQLEILLKSVDYDN